MSFIHNTSVDNFTRNSECACMKLEVKNKSKHQHSDDFYHSSGIKLLQIWSKLKIKHYNHYPNHAGIITVASAQINFILNNHNHSNGQTEPSTSVSTDQE